MSKSKPILGYWSVRGRGAAIRHMLAYLVVEYEEKVYNSREDWFLKDKPTIDLDFPNLPYYIDGPIRLTQSLTILQYLGRKFGLAGSNSSEANSISMIEQFLVDHHLAFSSIYRNPNCAQLKEAFLESLPKTTLQPLSLFLNQKPFIAGPKLTYVDFLLYEALKKLSLMAPGSLDAFPNLNQFLNRIEGLPTMVPYFAKRQAMFFNDPSAKWNATA